MIAKSKVAPLKRVTISQIELCGVLLAAMLLNNVVEVLFLVINITRKHAWAD